MRRFSKCLTPVVCAIIASLLAVVPVAAAGPEAASAAANARASSITTLSAATLARMQPRLAKQTPTISPADTRPFFKSAKGAAVLALIGAGAGYTLYSKMHDRVHSQAR